MGGLSSAMNLIVKIKLFPRNIMLSWMKSEKRLRVGIAVL
jgi:hypothetical protein